MNIQIFGKASVLIPKAQRWFTERGIKFRMIDLAQRACPRVNWTAC